MESKRGTKLKEFLDWIHHAYWIGAALVSSGIASGVMHWLASNFPSFAPYKWPAGLVLAGAIMFAFDWWFRRRKARHHTAAESNTGGGSSLISSVPSHEDLPNVDIDEFFRIAYRTNAELEVRKNMRILAHRENPEDPESFYLEFIGVGFISAQYDSIWWPMFRSQLLALLELNRCGGLLPISRMKGFYDSAAREYGDELADTKFEDWFRYLTSNVLLLRHPSDMVEITVKGKDFLKFLTHWGRGPDGKRL